MAKRADAQLNLNGSRSHGSGGIVLIDAPSNLGLRSVSGEQQGTWEAPAVLAGLGLAEALNAIRHQHLSRPEYSPLKQPGSRILNAQGIREFGEVLSAQVAKCLAEKEFPLVIGGDCSILLGCLHGARSRGEVGLVHIDGHSDFFHPGNYDERELRSAAGMDLALATGRGEAILAQWDGRPLIEDSHAVQIGERDELDDDYPFQDLFQSEITSFPVRKVLAHGVSETVELVLELTRIPKDIWVHVDVDVLAEDEMLAVDSPGSPGLTVSQLTQMLRELMYSGRVIGMDVTIYDPSMDLDRRYGRKIVECLRTTFLPAWRSHLHQ